MRALFLPSTIDLISATFHLVWRRCDGIDPLKATPSRRYYALRGWTWPAADA